MTGVGVDGKVILNGMLKEYYGKASAGYMRLNIGIAGVLVDKTMILRVSYIAGNI